MPIYIAPNSANPKFGTNNNLIELDAFITETHNYTNSVMSHPVEDGKAVVDDIVHEPITLELEAVISPYSVNLDNIGDTYRADDAYRQLYKLYLSKLPVTVFTGIMTYKNMAIASISIPRNKATSKTLRFTINFQQVRIVGSASVATDKLRGAIGVDGKVLGYGYSGNLTERVFLSEYGNTNFQEGDEVAFIYDGVVDYSGEDATTPILVKSKELGLSSELSGSESIDKIEAKRTEGN